MQMSPFGRVQGIMNHRGRRFRTLHFIHRTSAERRKMDTRGRTRRRWWRTRREATPRIALYTSRNMKEKQFQIEYSTGARRQERQSIRIRIINAAAKPVGARGGRRERNGTEGRGGAQLVMNGRRHGCPMVNTSEKAAITRVLVKNTITLAWQLGSWIGRSSSCAPNQPYECLKLSIGWYLRGPHARHTIKIREIWIYSYIRTVHYTHYWVQCSILKRATDQWVYGSLD